MLVGQLKSSCEAHYLNATRPYANLSAYHKQRGKQIKHYELEIGKSPLQF